MHMDTIENRPASVGQESVSRPKKQTKSPLHIGYLLLAVLVFWLGLSIGNGNIKVTGFPYPEKERTGLPTTFDYSSLDELYKAIRNNYDGKLTSDQILDGLKHGMARSTNDPYTEFMTATEAKDFNDNLQGQLTGIGAKLELDKDGNVIVQAPLVGSPAEAAGLRAKDVIGTIDNKTTYGMSVNDAVKEIRGDKGTKVTLGIVRGKTEALSITITRDVIKIPTVVSEVKGEGRIGYLQVSQFSDDTDELVQAAAQDFANKGIKKIILDLRDNPGGEVTTAVNLSSLWLDRGYDIVSQRRGDVTTSRSTATGVNTLKGMQTVVLINAGSASASEITALALRDHKVATIMGETSYGKGVVQRLLPFDDGSSLKVTIAKWYSPNGTNIDQKGVKPDKEIKFTEDDYKNGTDPQLAEAEKFLLGN